MRVKQSSNQTSSFVLSFLWIELDPHRCTDRGSDYPLGFSVYYLDLDIDTTLPARG